MRRLEGRVCLITGAAGSIGWAMATRFAVEGAWVVLADRDAARLAGRIEGRDDFTGIAADVADPDAVADLFATMERRFGRIDVLVNNAASWERDGPLTEIGIDDWNATLAGTLTSVFLCSREAIRRMRTQGGGSIVNIASVNGVFGLALPAYSAAKGAVLSLTRTLATLHGPDGIRVNAISPGTIRADSWNERLAHNPQELDEWAARYPLQRVGTPEEVAALAAHLASDESANTTGANLVMDGGLSAGRVVDF